MLAVRYMNRKTAFKPLTVVLDLNFLTPNKRALMLL